MDIKGDNFLYDPNFHRFADFLGLDKYVREDFSIAQKVLYLYDWSKAKSKSEEFVDVLRTAVKFKKELGETSKGKTLVKEMYKWARLNDDGRRADEVKRQEKEELTQKQQEYNEAKKRGEERREQWQSDKQKTRMTSEEAEARARASAEKLNKERAQQSRIQSDSSIKPKEIVNKVKSEEIKL